MKLFRVLVVVVALWLAVGSPALVGWQHRARPAEAQGPVGIAVSAACLGLSGGYCILLYGAVVYTALVARYYGVTLPSSPTAFVDAVKDWLDGDDPGAASFKIQNSLHPDWLTVTPDMVAEWTQIMDIWLNAGWSVETVAGYESVILRTDYIGNGSPYVELGEMSESENWTPLVSEHGWGGGGTFRFRYARAYADVEFSYYLTLEIWEGPLDTGVLRENKTFISHVAQGSAAFTVEYGYADLVASDIGKSFSARVRVFESTDVGHVSGHFGWHDMDLQYYDSAMQWQNSYLHPPDMDSVEGAASIAAAAGLRLNGAADVDNAYTWDGTADMALASGRYGAVVENAPDSPAEDTQGWLEGLFHGVTSPLTAIKNGIESIAGDVADVWEWAQALPETLVAAAAAAVVPDTDQMKLDLDGLGDTLKVKAPFSFLTAFYVALPNLFTGGSSCVEIDTQVDHVGSWPAYTAEMCFPAEMAVITKAISRVVAVVLMLFYAVSTARSMIGIDDAGKR